MAKCKICGEHYISKECPYCNMNIDQKEKKIQGSFNTYENKTKRELTEKEKLYKTIRYAIIVFFAIFILYTIIETYFINKAGNYMINEMQKVDKIQETMMKNIQNEFKIHRK